MSTIDEPAAANNGNLVFYTGNWYAARSTNGGASWTYVDPYADMSDFCCDQDVIYSPNYGIFIWDRLSYSLVGSNVIDRINVCVSSDSRRLGIVTRSIHLTSNQVGVIEAPTILTSILATTTYTSRSTRLA